MNFNFYIYLFYIIIFLGCTGNDELPLPEFSCNVNCILNISQKDSSYLQLVDVRIVGDSLNYSGINSAKVFVKSNTEIIDFIQLFNNKNFNYKSSKPISFDSGSVCFLEIEHPELGTVKSEDIVPLKPQLGILNVSDTSLIRISSFLQDRNRFGFSGFLKISGNSNQLIRIQCYLPNDYTSDIFGNVKQKKYLSSVLLEPLDKNEINFYNNEFFIIENSTKEYLFRFTGTALLNLKKLDMMIIKVSTVSDNLFEYAKQIHEIKLNGNSPFSEPIRLQTNIKNGYGIFGIQNTIVDTFYIK